MRVAYICADAGIPVFGTKGCSIHVQEFLRVLIRRGDEVRLYASRIGGDPLPGLEAVQVLQLSLDRAGPVAQREQASLAANYELGACLNQKTHSVWFTNDSPCLVLPGWSMRVPLVCRECSKSTPH